MKQKNSLSLGRPREFDRDEALQKSVTLFRKYGYDGVSISDLTRTIGITPTSLYAAFGNKENLYREALALYRKRSSLPNLDQDGSVAERVRALLMDTVRAVTDPDAPGCMVTLGMLTHSAKQGLLAEMVGGLRYESLKKVISFLDYAVAHGELSSDEDIQSLGRYVIALMQGIAIQAHDGANPVELFRLVDIAMRTWPS